MSCQVYANGMSIACKAADGKSSAAMPDVCFTPPQTPATPPGVPIPYPNTGMASDTTEGSKTVMISGEEVMLKDKSYFKTSSGDEAGNAPKKGVVTSKIQGKVNFCAWSMDVKFEGENIPRHLDITGHNEASAPPNAPPWPYVDTATITSAHPCHQSVQAEKTACAPPGATPHPSGKGMSCTPACQAARDCALPMKKDDKSVCCDPNTTGDHLVEVNSFTQQGTRGGLDIGSDAVLAALPSLGITLAQPKSSPRRLTGFEDYNDERAPTACANPDGTKGKHARMQAARDRIKRQCRAQQGGVPLDIFLTGEESFWTYDQAAAAGAKSHKQENPQCDEACTRAQLDAYHHDILPGETKAQKNSTPVRTFLPR